ncbi:hypothetical protein C6P46_004438 [Rhodotorula mucilaginosa]|uniref:Uncharacterized protein n=1 Tax=Rhodotorula mucilaginosa TaxID=5537 RepID=A0A9P7B5D3_RHOMI|nr:hypothetical protein C6P46_004438 [Rhodotorula mucilaginosa]
MRGPIDSNALPPDLAARFAALRAPAAPPADATTSPQPRSPTSKQSNEPDDPLERRLEQLSTPTKVQIERGVKVEMKGFSPPRADRTHNHGDYSLPDDEVEQYIAGLDSATTDDQDSIVLPSPPTVQPVRAPGARARQSIPSLSPSLLDTLSGVEVQFFRPSLGAATGDLDVADAKGFEAGSAEEDLIRRLRDELSLEEKVTSRNEASTSSWDARLEGLKGVVAGGPVAAGQAGSIGTPPDLGELERQLKKRQRKRDRRRGATDDDSDEDDTDSTTTEEVDSDSEVDSEDKSKREDAAV